MNDLTRRSFLFGIVGIERLAQERKVIVRYDPKTRVMEVGNCPINGAIIRVSEEKGELKFDTNYPIGLVRQLMGLYQQCKDTYHDSGMPES